MKNKRNIGIASVFSFLIILCLTATLTTYFVSQRQIASNQDIKYSLLSDKFSFILNIKTKEFLTYVTFGVNYINLFTPFNSTFQNFIDLSVLQTNLDITNELRIHYFITESNRITFQTRLSQNLNKEIVISSIDDLGNSIPSPIRDVYCPITYISPNSNNQVYNSIGLDICNISPFLQLTNALNNTNDFVILPRTSLSSKNIVLDIAQKTTAGFSLLSITIIDLLNVISKDLRLSDNKHILFFKNNVIYDSCLNNCDSHLHYRRNIIFRNNTDFSLELFYPNDSPFNLLALLIGVIILIFLILAGVASFLLWKNEESAKTLEKYQFANEMLGYVNHEIRNPLNSIKGLINISIYDLQQILDMHPELNLVISNLGTAENSCELLNHIVNDILDIKKIQENKLKINNQELSLKLFEKDLYKTLALKLNEKPHIKYFFNLHDSLDIIIIDRHRLLQIMINFLTNALKFTESGSITVDVRKEIINGTDCISFYVKDTGRGISESKRSLIFQPYSQVDISDSLRSSGVGLGLYLCQMITECMNGIIGFSSVENSGSTFFTKFKLIVP